MPDWYPRLRNAQIHLAEVWIMVFQAKAAVWGIPTANVTDLTGALSAAKREVVRRMKAYNVESVS